MTALQAAKDLLAYDGLVPGDQYRRALKALIADYEAMPKATITGFAPGFTPPNEQLETEETHMKFWKSP